MMGMGGVPLLCERERLLLENQIPFHAHNVVDAFLLLFLIFIIMLLLLPVGMPEFLTIIRWTFWNVHVLGSAQTAHYRHDRIGLLQSVES